MAFGKRREGMGNSCINAPVDFTPEEDLQKVSSRSSPRGGDAGQNGFIMRPAGTAVQHGGRAKTHKTKTTRESVDPGAESSQRKKSKKVQGSNLEKPDRTLVSDQSDSWLDHGTKKEVTGMQSAPKEEAKSLRRNGHLPPAGMLDAEDDNSEEDLYRTAEEIEQERLEKCERNAASSVPELEDQNSVAAPERILTYSEREWKGNTTKSHLIRKGYEAVTQNFESVRRVRGDNYCALRATLFQLLSQSSKIPDWLRNSEVMQWPRQLTSVQDLVAKWRFPFGDRDEGTSVEQLQHCLKLLKTKWQEAVQCASSAERERVCQQVFMGNREEYELLEALKFLMLKTAVQLHTHMEEGSTVPDFCWLLFARDTSKCPRTFLTNHIRHVGFSGGLEQVEMFLLGYSLQQTIQVYRLYKTDTEEFITYYPDDHRDDWPRLSLVTEDDRHYNVLIPKQAKKPSPKFDKSGRPRWNPPSGDRGQSSAGTLL